MKSKKIISTIVWFVLSVVWCGVYKFILFKISMYYSNLAAMQLEDDSTYGELQFQSTANTITTIIFFVVIAFFVYRIIKIWFTNKEHS